MGWEMNQREESDERTTTKKQEMDDEAGDVDEDERD